MQNAYQGWKQRKMRTDLKKKKNTIFFHTNRNFKQILAQMATFPLWSTFQQTTFNHLACAHVAERTESYFITAMYKSHTNPLYPQLNSILTGPCWTCSVYSRSRWKSRTKNSTLTAPCIYARYTTETTPKKIVWVAHINSMLKRIRRRK